MKDRARARHHGRIDHPTVDNLRRPVEVRRNDPLRPGDLSDAGYELFHDNGGLGRVNAKLSPGASAQSLPALQLQGLTIMGRERGAVEGRRLTRRARRDGQPT